MPAPPPPPPRFQVLPRLNFMPVMLVKPLPTVQVVLSLDADFLVSAGLHEKLSSPEASAALLEDVSIQRNVVVLPAFETETSLGLEKGGDIANLAQRCEIPFPSHGCFPEMLISQCPLAGQNKFACLRTVMLTHYPRGFG